MKPSRDTVIRVGLVIVVLSVAGIVDLGWPHGVGGDATHTVGVPPGASPTVVRASAAQVVDRWRAEVMRQGREGGGTRFANLSRARFRAQLALVPERFDVRIVSVEILHPRQDAPQVVIQGRDPAAIAREVPLIIGVIDPQGKALFAYEGFLLEARDESGLPFLITFNYWRGRKGGSHIGGGQWASSPDLYPYPHG